MKTLDDTLKHLKWAAETGRGSEPLDADECARLLQIVAAARAVAKRPVSAMATGAMGELQRALEVRATGA